MTWHIEKFAVCAVLLPSSPLASLLLLYIHVIIGGCKLILQLNCRCFYHECLTDVEFVFDKGANDEDICLRGAIIMENIHC